MGCWTRQDPAKIIKLIIQEMEEALVEVRSVAARNIAEQKHLKRQIDSLNKDASGWQKKAELAVEKGTEDLARAALVEKQAATQKIEILSKEQAAIQESLDKLQEDIMRLQEKLSEARSKQKALEVRKRSASVRLKAKTTQNPDKIDDAISRFERYERRIDHLESQIEAFELTENKQALNEQFRQLESSDCIEQELAAIKKKVA